MVYSFWGGNMVTLEIALCVWAVFLGNERLLVKFQMCSLLVWLPNKEVKLISVMCWFVSNLSDRLNAEVSGDGNEHWTLQNKTKLSSSTSYPRSQALKFNFFCFLVMMTRFSFSVFFLYSLSVNCEMLVWTVLEHHWKFSNFQFHLTTLISIDSIEFTSGLLGEWFIHYPEVHLMGQTHLDARYQTWQQIILSCCFDLSEGQKCKERQREGSTVKTNNVPDQCFD